MPNLWLIKSSQIIVLHRLWKIYKSKPIDKDFCLKDTFVFHVMSSELVLSIFEFFILFENKSLLVAVLLHNATGSLDRREFNRFSLCFDEDPSIAISSSGKGVLLLCVWN